MEWLQMAITSACFLLARTQLNSGWTGKFKLFVCTGRVNSVANPELSLLLTSSLLVSLTLGFPSVIHTPHYHLAYYP